LDEAIAGAKDRARGLTYLRSEQRDDARHARRDARRDQPDVDTGEVWTPYMSGLVEFFFEQAMSAYLSTLQREANLRVNSASIRSELHGARETAERRARQTREDQVSTPKPTSNPTTHDERIRARRLAHAGSIHQVRLEEEARMAESTVMQLEARMAELTATCAWPACGSS
jgi:hypothetical protein